MPVSTREHSDGPKKKKARVLTVRNGVESDDSEQEDGPPEKRLKKTHVSRVLINENLQVRSPLFSPILDADLNDEGFVGTIEKVVMKNFMCHSNLEFSFVSGKHVHFIVGRNGSGKSAVLNAIMLSLGGKASLTSRGKGSNVKGFIQTSKHACDLSVTLSNTGPEAYRPETYGPSIIVERRVTIEGSSTYKIKTHAGKLQSVKRDELDNILHALNIQVDNPVCVLTQEASKTFISGKDVKKKYEFFVKATQLQAIWDQYKEAEKQSAAAESTLNVREKDCLTLKAEIDKLKADFERIKAIEGQEEKLTILKHERAWAIVYREEAKRDSLVAQKVKALDAVDQAKSSVKKYDEKVAGYVKNIKEWAAKKRKNDEACASLISQLSAKKASCEELECDIRSKKVRLNHFHTEIKHKEQEIDDITQAIEELKAKSQEDFAEAERQRLANISDLERRIAELQVRVNSIEQEQTSINKYIEEETQKADFKAQESVSLNQIIRAKMEEISTIRSSLNNQECLFGPKIPELRKRIDEFAAQGRFKRKPIGPVGLFVRLKDPQTWSFAVETCLGKGTLTSFCCDNFEDRAVLLSLMKNIFQGASSRHMPSTIVSKFLPRVHDVSRNKVISDSYYTVFDAIEVSDPVIMNCLIDQKSIENILLIRESRDAQNVMMDFPPRNCICAYTATGDQHYPSPKYRFYSCQQRPVTQFLRQSHTEEDVRMKQGELNLVRQQMNNVSHEQHEIGQQIKRLKDQRTELTEQIHALRKSITIWKNEIEEQSENQMLADVSAQEDDLIKAKGYKAKIEEQREREQGELRLNEKRLTELKHEHKKLAEERKTIKDDTDKILNELQMYENEKDKANTEKQRYIKESKEADSSVKEIEMQIKEASEKAESTMKLAEELTNGERVETNRSPHIISNQIDKLTEACQEHMGTLDKDAITKSLSEKVTDYEKVNNEITKLQAANKKQKNNITQRKKNFHKIRQAISMRLQYLFTLNLNVGNYAGELMFDHEHETLNIKAAPGSNTLSGQLGGVNSLSGGERSYLTVCFLLALYDAAEIPFHFLDEYDVFMDDVHRAKSMELMMAKAREKSRDQFTFLSPLDLPKTVDPNIAEIHKMPDPERGGPSPSTSKEA